MTTLEAGAGIAITPAPINQRLTAAFIDFIILFVGFCTLFLFVPALRLPGGLCLTINTFVFLGYHVGITRAKSWGATPGKWLMGIRVVDDKYARPLSNNRAVGRAFSMMLPLVPFLYFFYVFYPGMLIDRYEYRVGTGKMHQKMMAGGVLTPEERQRWADFDKYVQQPLYEMEVISLKMTGGALFAWILLMAFHPQRKTVHDMICETMVVQNGDVSDVPAPNELPDEPPAL